MLDGSINQDNTTHDECHNSKTGTKSPHKHLRGHSVKPTWSVSSPSLPSLKITWSTTSGKIEFIHSSSTVYRFNPVTHLLTRSDFHRSILLVHQITEVSQEIIQKLAISIFSVTNMKPVLIETEFRSSLSSVSSSELFDFLSFCLPPSLLLCHLFCPLL